MESHVLVGPDLNIEKIKNIYKLENYRIHGLGQKYIIDCKILNIKNNSNVIIHAHGEVNQYGHNIKLCSTSQYTRDSLKEISNKKIVNIELLSCFGGAAIKEIEHLPKGSTLMTFVSADSSSAVEIDQAISNISLSFQYINNPFVKFSSYIFTNPDSVQFAIKSAKENNIFSTKIYSLIDNMQDSNDVRTWHLKQLDSFITFCKNIQNEMSDRATKQIKELIELYQDPLKLSDWLKQFDNDRYKEFLFMNMLHRKDLKALEKIIDMGIDLNAQINGYGPLRLAAQNGNNKAIEMLLTEGVNVNSVFADGLTALHVASNQGQIRTVTMLINNGSNINAKDDEGATALLFALRNNHDKVAYELINSGADVNITTNNGVSALQIIFLIKQDKPMLVKLLSAGANTNIEAGNGLKILDYTHFSETTLKLAKSIKLYNKSPIAYILKHNNKIDSALKAIQNIKQQSHLHELFLDIEKTEHCLESQDSESILNLNKICGKDGLFYFDHPEL